MPGNESVIQPGDTSNGFTTDSGRISVWMASDGSRWGCVAKTSGSLVDVVFVLTIARPTHRVHEPKAPIQVASLPIMHHSAVCPVVSALPAQLPQQYRK